MQKLLGIEKGKHDLFSLSVINLSLFVSHDNERLRLPLFIVHWNEGGHDIILLKKGVPVESGRGAGQEKSVCFHQNGDQETAKTNLVFTVDPL